MASHEVIDEVIATGPRPNAAAGATTRRGMVDESVRSGELESHREPAATAQPDTVGGGRSGRPMKESTLKLLDKLNQPDEGDGGDPDDPDRVPAKPVDPAAAVAAAPGETAVVDDKPSDVDVVRAENARLVEHNRKLIAETEEAAKVKRGEPSARDKALDEAERMYLDDNVGAIRKLIATVLGVDDPKHPDVDAEMAGLFTDLTARELNVPLEQATKAVREAARAKQMLARDKRERKAEDEAKKATQVEPDQEAKQAAEVGAFIDGRLASKAADGQTIGDQYPLLMSFAEDLDGLKPSELIWRVLQKEVKSGVIPSDPDNDKMLHAAARLIEDHYATVAEKISAKVKPKTDTAKPGNQPAAVVKTSEAQRQTPAARNITNAQASVAPAAPPKQPTQQVAPERPKFKSKKEAQDYALRHLPQ